MKVFFINLGFLLFFPWMIEFSLIKIDYQGNYTNTEKLKNVLSKQKQINNDRNKKIEEFISKNILPTIYPGTSIDFKIFKKLMVNKNFFPLGAQPNKQLYLCDEGYGFVSYKTDSLGFRNKDEVWDKYPYNLLIFGDSYVHGSCVEDKYTISGHLLNMGIENINLGLGDNQPLIYSSGIKQFTYPKPPKNIALVLSLHNDLLKNDIYEDYRNITRPYDYFYSEDDSKFHLSKKGYDYFKNVNEILIKDINFKNKQNYVKGEKRESIYNFIKLPRFRLLLQDKLKIIIKKNLFCFSTTCFIGSIEDHLFSDIKNSIHDVNVLLESCSPNLNCNPIVILISHSTDWDDNFLYDMRRELFNKEITSLKLSKFNFNYLDSTEFLDQTDIKNFAPAGGHLSIEGYRKVALKIKESLK